MMKETLASVLKPFGPSGSEKPIADVIKGLVAPFVDEIQSDVMGNLIAIKRGNGAKRIMFSAHMDSIGLIALDADKEGFIRVSNIGGIYPRMIVGRHIVFANGVAGITHFEPTKENEALALRTLFVDVGADSREEALEKVPIGTMAALQHQWTDMGDRVAAPYMDDRAACAVLIEFLKVLPKTDHDIFAVFSVQEEVGCRGAEVAAYALKPDIGIALDVTPAGDTPKSDPLPVKVGAGPAIKVKDGYSISTPQIRDGLTDAARGAGIPFQFEVLPYGGTDASAIMLSRAGVPSATLSIACRYVHAPVELVSIKDMEDAVRLLSAYIQGLK